jgi:hypothetical protein
MWGCHAQCRVWHMAGSCTHLPATHTLASVASHHRLTPTSWILTLTPTLMRATGMMTSHLRPRCVRGCCIGMAARMVLRRC